MAYGQNLNIRFGGPVTPMVKRLLIINASVFLLQQILSLMAPGTIESIFGLSHDGLTSSFRFWQIFTYMFLHGGWLHIIFNLLALWMFAGELERLWGSVFFLKYYLYSGIGAGLFIAGMNTYLFHMTGASPVTLGASGAIYALLLAYGINWPNREVLLYFLIPVKIKYLLVVFGLIEFFGTISTASSGGKGISHIGHLGGLITGLVILYFRSGRIPIFKNINFASRLLKKLRLKKKKKQIDKRIKAKVIIDQLLEKIARSGMQSLSSEEKKQLEWARRHYYPDKKNTFH